LSKQKEDKAVYIGRTIAPKFRMAVHRKNHPDATFTPIVSNLN
jgi:predicted GIY-YIG superfamily endonuclease